MKHLQLLVVDDDADMRQLLLDELPRRGFAVSTAAGTVAAREHLSRTDTVTDVVLTDLRMPGDGGLKLLEWLTSERPDLPAVVLTGFGNIEVGVEAMRRGAVDFLEKPVDLDRLGLALRRGHELFSLRSEVRRLQPPLVQDSDEVLTGVSPAIERVRQLVRDVAPLSTTVLVTGESGTGKELVARALHRLSPRRGGPFVAINVAAMPETLVEAQLFGHGKGAFTDAREAKPGLLAAARGGTLFLDEIGEMSMALQSKLLRVLQERKVRPIGETAEIDVDFRLVCATHRDLDEEVTRGRFRDDLRWRIDVVSVEVPPLRQRGHDVLLLASHFIAAHSEKLDRPVRGLAPSAAALLKAWHWPGNVRELENAMERAVGLARLDHIVPTDLPARIAAPKATPEVAVDGVDRLEDVERRHVLAVLERCHGNKQATALKLGIGRKTLYRRLQEWGVATASDDES